MAVQNSLANRQTKTGSVKNINKIFYMILVRLTQMKLL